MAELLRTRPLEACSEAFAGLPESVGVTPEELEARVRAAALEFTST